ncbi:MAG: hypothetical protein JO282_00960 [Alphaproteobacteria bacterium]|nr:hypothetical protein [Alphaproteobacteria bacterium]
MKRSGLTLAAVLLLLLIGTAAASQQGQTAVVYWKAADKCAKQAQAAFPDYNAESNAKRDARLKECLSGGNLAPRQPLSPTPPQ